MYTNRIPRIRRLVVPCRRHSSQLSSKYPFTKLRALPFQISKEEAILDMATYAAFTCFSPQFFSSYLAKLFKGWFFEPFRPVRITPVYFPAWVIDGEISLDISRGKEKDRTTGYFQSSYLPGCDFRVLSWASLSIEKPENAVPFTTDLEVQYNTEIVCLPYTISPLATLDLLRLIPSESATIYLNVGVDPSTIQHGLFAAYPILIPLYLAQYESYDSHIIEKPAEQKQRFMTLFIEASKPKGQIHTEKLNLVERIPALLPPAPKILLDLGERVHEISRAIDIFDVLALRGPPKPFFRFTIPGRDGIASTIAGRLNELISFEGINTTLASASGNTMSDVDLRIRPYDREEKKSVAECLASSRKIELVKAMITALEDGSVDSSDIQKTGGPKIPGNMKEVLQVNLKELEAKKHATTPSWWKDWLKTSKVESQS